MNTRALLFGLLAGGCTGSYTGGEDLPPGEVPELAVSGTVVDFRTGQPIVGQATVTTGSLTPAPAVTVQGADFQLEGVPGHSIFNILVGSPPAYRNTYGAAIEVVTSDVDGLEVPVVAEAYLAELAAAFGVTATSDAILLARAVDEAGAPVADVPRAAFQLGGQIQGPFFLDEALDAAPGLTSTSASGWVVFFRVGDGLVTVSAAVGSGYTLNMPSSPVAANVVTVADIVVLNEEVAPPPVNVSFRNQVTAVFARKGCDNCHSGGGIGFDLGNLTLDGGTNLMYREITEEESPSGGIRIDLANPEASRLLTMPSVETPADSHPNVSFANTLDPDYQLLLVWIREGALLN